MILKIISWNLRGLGNKDRRIIKKKLIDGWIVTSLLFRKLD